MKLKYFYPAFCCLVIFILESCTRKPTTAPTAYINSEKLKKIFEIQQPSYYVYKNLKDNSLDSLYIRYRSLGISKHTDEQGNSYSYENYSLSFSDTINEYRLGIQAHAFYIANGDYFTSIIFKTSDGYSYWGACMVDSFQQGKLMTNPQWGGPLIATEVKLHDTLSINGIQFSQVQEIESIYDYMGYTVFTTFFSETEGLLTHIAAISAEKCIKPEFHFFEIPR